MPPLTVFDTRDALMAAAATRLAIALRDAIAERGNACAALSGGSTPEPAYRLLARADIDWPRVTFVLVDERFMPVEHTASNEAMMRRALKPALDAGATLLRMAGDRSKLEDAAAEADALYSSRQIDVALMGMGEDAHTASWFPDACSEALSSTQTVVAVRAPAAPGSSERLTLTRAAVARVGSVLLLITGNRKRVRLEAALKEPMERAPVAALFADAERQPEVLWAP